MRSASASKQLAEAPSPPRPASANTARLHAPPIPPQTAPLPALSHPWPRPTPLSRSAHSRPDPRSSPHRPALRLRYGPAAAAAAVKGCDSDRSDRSNRSDGSDGSNGSENAIPKG